MSDPITRAFFGAVLDIAKIIAASIVVMVAICLAAGCAPAPVHIDQAKTVFVDRPIFTPCLSRAEADRLKAARPAKVGARLTGDAMYDASILGAKALREEGWDDQASALIDGCAE